ncbi:MAG: hypothetical protein M0P69_09405 [Bacteroidales bacterium]|nr:hypothetical protein [Bacteroidales bacterium]
MMKEEISLRKLKQRLEIEQKRRAFNSFMDSIGKTIILKDTQFFKRNNRLIVRIYYPGVVKIHALTQIFRDNDIYGYLDYVSPAREYAEFVIYIWVE